MWETLTSSSSSSSSHIYFCLSCESDRTSRLFALPVTLSTCTKTNDTQTARLVMKAPSKCTTMISWSASTVHLPSSTTSTSAATCVLVAVACRRPNAMYTDVFAVIDAQHPSSDVSNRVVSQFVTPQIIGM